MDCFRKGAAAQHTMTIAGATRDLPLCPDLMPPKKLPVFHADRTVKVE